MLGGILEPSRRGPSSPWWVGPRWPTSSPCSRCWPPRWTPSSSAAGWPSPSWPPGARASGARSSTQTTSRTAAPCSLRACEILLPDRHPGPRARRHLRAARRGTGHGASVKVIEGDLPDGWTGLDIGPGPAAAFAGVVAGAGTVLVERAARRVRGQPLRRAGPRSWPKPWPSARASRSSAAATAPARSRSWA